MAPVALQPLDQLRSDWEVQSRTSDSGEALRALARVEPVVATLAAQGVADLRDLVASLHPGGAGYQRERAAAVFRAMLRSQSAHPLIARAALQAVLPGLVSVARRLAWGRGGEWEDGGSFFVDAVTTAWEVIISWAGEDRDYAVLDLLSAVRCRLRRQLLRHRTRGGRMVPVAEPATFAAPAAGTSGPELLAQALDELSGSGLDVADADVLYAHRVLGFSLTELAAMTGHSRRQLGERRDRAVAALTA